MATAAMERGSERGLNGALGFMVAAGVAAAVSWASGRPLLAIDAGTMMLQFAALPLGVLGGFMLSDKAPARPVRSALYFVATALVALGAIKLFGGSNALLSFHMLAASGVSALIYSKTLGMKDEEAPVEKVDWNAKYNAATRALAATDVAINQKREHDEAVLAEFERRLGISKSEATIFDFEAQEIIEKEEASAAVAA